ncbi:Uncharacterized protein K02A2.6 [Araneus ventricosus]|uniref:RNA-directed DNA polymerase n=1 Tax=Araneus ventricosus TaxID=182803 RepID=A0A4Y2UAR6_ARAVE|nr:Uncharacterized protein K02A2.6 [Araneus ventricosus]
MKLIHYVHHIGKTVMKYQFKMDCDRGCRIIIPKSHQAEVLNQIHEGHQGITKCRARARCSVYRPGISKVIEEKIKSCTACIQESSNRHQLLIPTSFPERPWEVLGLDLFKYKNSWYLLISDYYSRYPEIARLDRLTSAEIINHCKSIFSRHGIPDVVRSDNGSQFDPVKTVEFKDFAKSYGFTHISSSPKFSQSNGLIEAAVKTVKARIKKSRDPYLALMAYRATPLENGFSPSELLMVNKKVLEAKEERRIEGQKTNYDKHHSVRNLDELDPGQNVWITDRRVTGKVLKKTPYPRSYLVQSGRRVYRRNRKHLIPSPDFHPEPEPEDDSDVTGYQHSPADADPGCPRLMSSPQSPMTYPERASSSTEVSPDPYVTRSDKSLPKTSIEPLFEDTIRTHFSNFFLIATDASKSQQITSIAGTSSTNSFAYRLQHLNSIFSAEALALCQALDELPNDEDNLLLLTDSLLVLRALANLSIKSHKIILRLAAKISTREKFHQNIVLLWTPGHAGIKWNEKADTLARRVLESDLNIQWVTVEDIITQLKVHSGNQTDATYRGSKYYAILGDIPSIQTIAPWLKNRREYIIIARIISRMIITSALLHRFGLHDNPLCSMCKCDNSIEHILLYCRKYSLIRQSLCQRLHVNLAGISTFKSFLSACHSCTLFTAEIFRHLLIFSPCSVFDFFGYLET